MKILIKNKKVLDALVDELEGKLEIMKDDMPDAPDTEDLKAFVIPDIQALKTPIVYNTNDMPNLMGDYVEAAWENYKIESIVTLEMTVESIVKVILNLKIYQMPFNPFPCRSGPSGPVLFQVSFYNEPVQ